MALVKFFEDSFNAFAHFVMGDLPVLKDISINEFKNCFGQWEKHLNRCIASNGEYFEGD